MGLMSLALKGAFYLEWVCNNMHHFISSYNNVGGGTVETYVKPLWIHIIEHVQFCVWIDFFFVGL